MSPRPTAPPELSPARAAGWPTCLLLVLFGGGSAAAQVLETETDRIDITGRQNLTLGSGARAYGMGGAFLARADDATAASWNPAGLSYLRAPELSLVGAFNSFDTVKGPNSDSFQGSTLDFGAFTWPVGAGEVRGAVQISYQRAISFDGTRHIEEYDPVTDEDGNVTQQLARVDDGVSDGGFDVVAVGTGLRLSRHVRAGFTVNRWLNGYEQNLQRSLLRATDRPLREFALDFRPSGWSFNFGLIVSPVENLNVAVVYKTPFTAGIHLDKARRDFWGSATEPTEITSNAWSSDVVRLEFPYSFGFGLSWRPRDTLTFSADYTRSGWANARIRDYFELPVTPPADEAGNPAPARPPRFFPELQYPTLGPVPDPANPQDPARLTAQQDAVQIRAGAEWVLIHGGLKVPLRAGYFNDRQITPAPGGDPLRFNGVTFGTGIILGPLLLDLAYVYEFGQYYVAAESPSSQDAGTVASVVPPVRYALTTNRVYASVIYRFSGHWRP